MTGRRPLPSRPLLPGFFRMIPMGPDSVQLRSAGRVIRLAAPGIGEYGPPLLSALDGRSTLAELASRFPLERAALELLVRRLHDDGVLVAGAEGNGGPPPGNLAVSEFHDVVGEAAGDAHAALARARVLFVGLGPVARTAARNLAAAGVGTLVLADVAPVTALDQAILPGASEETGRPRSRVSAGECLQAAKVAIGGFHCATVVMEGSGGIREILERSTPVDLVVVEVDESTEQAEAANAACLAAGVAALFHEVTTLEGVVGPRVESGGPGCYRCLLSRRTSHLRFYEEHLAYLRSLRSGDIPARPPALLGGGAAMVGGALSVEIIGLLTGSRRPVSSQRTVLVADFRTSEIRREKLLAVPGCPTCEAVEEVTVNQ